MHIVEDELASAFVEIGAVHFPLFLVDVIGPCSAPALGFQAHSHEADPGKKLSSASLHNRYKAPVARKGNTEVP